MLYNVKAALFDLDGVVVFTDRFHFLAWKKLSDEMGWRFDEVINHRLRGISRMASLEVILSENNVKLSTEERTELCDRKNRYYIEFLEDINSEHLYPGVIDFIEKLKSKGVLIGLCSASRNAEMVLQKLNITELFDCVVSGADIKNTKPDPEIFLKAAKILNRHPFNCVVFEDAESGIEAARRGSFRYIGVGLPEQLPDADETITAYEEIDVDSLIEFGCIHPPEVHPWKVIQRRISAPQCGYWESIFSLSNGYIGVRGAYEEESERLKLWEHAGAYINGVYETVQFPPPGRIDDLKKMDILVNLFDWRLMTVSIDGCRFSLDCGKIIDHCRELDLHAGVLRRSVIWEHPCGKQIEIQIIRLVSMSRLHSAAIRYTVRPVNFSGAVEIYSAIEGNTHTAQLKEGGPEKKTVKLVNGDTLFAHYQMNISKLHIALGCSHMVADYNKHEMFVQQEHDRTEYAFRFNLEQGETAQVDKHVCFYSSMDTPVDAFETTVLNTMSKDSRDGMDLLLSEQGNFWRNAWDMMDITVDGCPEDQQAVRFELFHLRQNHTVENKRSISATGVSGDNYHGWIFWDTEIFMIPFFVYHDPAAARALMEYRCNTLDGARRRAEEIQLPGACYGWSTLDGTENNGYFPASTTQYHINCDIGYAFWRYYNVTQDFKFVAERGFPVLAEICRMFASLGKYIPMHENKFCFNYLCGPDEYNYHVNNNCYTNLLTQKHFDFTLDIYDRMKRECPETLAQLTTELNITDREISSWRQIMKNIYVPFNEKLQIHEQDDGYLYRDPVNMDALPDNYEFKHSFTELNLGRMQVSKQGDVVLINFLLGDQFSSEMKRNNFDFYIQRTKHVSSLSACIHSIMAAETGRNELVYDLLRQTIYMDLCDLKKNTNCGIHFACTGGTWMVVVNGLAGFRDYEDGLHFNPQIPAAWKGYCFKLWYRNRQLEVKVTETEVHYTLLKGNPLIITSQGEALSLQDSGTVITQTLKTAALESADL